MLLASSMFLSSRMEDGGTTWCLVSATHLAQLIRKGLHEVLVIDSRSFLEYNTHHVSDAINVCCSKLVKRRLQQDKISVRDLLGQATQVDFDGTFDIIVYDQCTTDPAMLSADCFLMVLLKKLVNVFKNVSLLRGGFLEFQATHPSLCESKTTGMSSSGQYKCPPLTSMSQPCLPVANIGPTKILPFLYLGSQHDALSQDTMQTNGINYMLNVSTTCPKPPFISDGHFLRIPVNDNYSDKLLPYFQDAFQFLDKVREANGCVLVHCLAGISRSATLAIAYIMKHLDMSTDDSYRYVKDKRPTISPNFNFLGQLLEYEKQLKQIEDGSSGPEVAAHKRQCIAELRSPTSPTVATPKLFFKPQMETQTVQSPTTALAKLTFGGNTPTSEKPLSQESELPFPQIPTTSLDSLSFMPCFAKEDTAGASHGGRLPSSPVSSMPPSLTFSVTTHFTKVGGGTKRPLSTSMVENKTSDRVPTIKEEPSGSGATSWQQVTLRSPETKAKRPLVRPNSIAFSSYPIFDLPSIESESSSGRPSPCTDDDIDSGGLLVSRGKTHLTTTGNLRKEQGSKNLTGQVPVRHNVSSPSGATAASRNFEQGRKSRSLEDILNSPDEGDDCVCPGLRRAGKKRHLQTSDMFPPPIGLDNARCRGAPDPHQSSSSISSSGSHNSLHGSLEIIQVS